LTASGLIVVVAAVLKPQKMYSQLDTISSIGSSLNRAAIKVQSNWQHQKFEQQQYFRSSRSSVNIAATVVVVAEILLQQEVFSQLGNISNKSTRSIKATGDFLSNWQHQK